MSSPRFAPALMHALLALIVAFTAGCPPRTIIVDGVELPYETAGERVFGRAKGAHEEGRHEEAIEGLRDYIARFPSGDDVEEARWLLARSYFALDREADGRRALQMYLDKHPRAANAAEARLELGLSHYRGGEHLEASRLLGPVYDESRGETKLKIARILAEVALGMEDWPGAVQWIGEIRRLARDPDAQQAADAELLDLIDRRVPQAGLALLHQTLPADSPALPMVTMKIAKIHLHQREYLPAKEMAQSYLSRWSRGAFAEDARRILDRIARLSEVEPKVVGVLLPLSGRAQAFGDAVMRGIGLALDAGASHGITLLIRDTAGEPESAVAALEELVLEEKAVVIIGPLLTGTSLAAAAKAEELGVPMISLSRAEGLTELGPWIFRNALSDAAQAAALVDYAVEHLGARSFGIMYPNHEYGRGLMHHFWNEVEARRLEVRGVESYNHDETTFQPLVRSMVGRHHLQYRHDYMQEIRRIRAEVEDPVRRRRALSRALDEVLPIPDFDVLFIPDSYRTVGLIAPALAVEDVITNVCDRRDIDRIKETTGRDKLTEVRLLGPNSWHHPELVTRGGRHVRCSVFVDGFFAESARGDTKAFVERYRQVHGAGSTPGYLEAYGYDTASIVRHIIEERRPRDRSAFREELIGLAGYPGSTGETRFGAGGEAIKPLFLLTVEKDAIVEIDPTPPEEETPTG